MKTIGIGFLGMGTIGGELVKIIQKNADHIRSFYGLDLQIRKIFVRDVNKKRDIDTTGLPLTDAVDEVLESEDVQLICECMGGAGTDKTYAYVKRAISRGLNVVMSSKKVLAYHGLELVRLSHEKHTVLCYDATVGGGIPIEKVVENSFYCQNIQRITGILNGTSNYILSNMSLKHQSFKEALKGAQKKGYAENDPSEDIDSYDALYKAEVLSLFCLEKIFDIHSVTPRSIRDIRGLDFELLEEEGFTIKPIVNMEIENGKLYYIIGPAVLSKTEHPCSKINENNNIITLVGSGSGELSFSGQGAGKSPTASVMFDDILNTFLYRNNAIQYTGIRPFDSEEEDNQSLYLHLKVSDKPGQIAEISSVLADLGINIDKFITRNKTGELYDAFLFVSHKDNINRETLVKTIKKHHVKVLCVIPVIYEQKND